MHTLLVIAGFFLIVLAPVLAAQASRRRRGGGKHDSSGSIPIARPTSGPVVTHHLRPRPRRRARH